MSDDSLFACGVLKAKDILDMSAQLRHVYEMPMDPHEKCVIEQPRIYPHSPVPPNDIAKLSIMVGVAIGFAVDREMEVKLVRPTQVDKTVTEHRVRKRVANLDDMLYCVPKSLQHNAIDAIALGLREVGR